MYCVYILCMCVYSCMCNVSAYACVRSVCMHGNVCRKYVRPMCMYVCIYTRTYIHAYICTYIHTHTHAYMCSEFTYTCIHVQRIARKAE